MGLADEYIELLRNGEIELENARELFEHVSSFLSPDERALCTKLLARLEVQEELQTRRPEILGILPEGWFRDYISYCQVNEAPDSFHLFTSMAVFGHLIGRKRWVNLGLTNIYPPLSVFLISPPGQVRRSTAIRHAVQMGMNAGASVLQDTATPEGLIEYLRDITTLLVVADEAATLLSKQEYMNAMPQVLCSLLDCPEQYQRKLRGTTIVVERPTVNLILGCASEWITTAMPRHAVAGGLFSRMLLVNEFRRKRLIPLPAEEADPESLERMSLHLSMRLRKLTQVQPGPFLLKGEARDLYVQFYEENDANMMEADDRMRIYFSRKPDFVLRLTMILQLASGDDSYELSREMLETALALLHLVEPGMQQAYRQAGIERYNRQFERVRRCIYKHGRIGRAQLLRQVSDVVNGNELSEILKSMGRGGLIRWPPRKEIRSNRIMTIYETLE